MWVIHTEDPPYVFKLHIETLTNKEINMATIKRSVEALIPNSSETGKKNGENFKVSAQLFSKKKQFKVFVEIYDKPIAHEFFKGCFKMK